MAEPEHHDTRTRAREVAWATLLEGERPTQRGVIERLGGRGSPNVVNEVLKAFWGEVGQALQRPAVPHATVQAMIDLWARAVDEAARHFAEDRQRLEAHTQSAREESLAAQARAREALAQVRVQHQRHSELASKMEQLREALAAEGARRAAAEQQSAAAERAREAAQQQVADAKHAFADALSLEHARSDALERRLIAQLSEQKAAHARLEKIFSDKEAASKAREAALSDRLHAQALDLAEGRATLKQAEAARAEATTRLHAAEQRAEARALELIKSETRREALGHALDAAEHRLRDQAAEVAAVQQRLEGLLAENAVLKSVVQKTPPDENA